jgi:hypothetical protein
MGRKMRIKKIFAVCFVAVLVFGCKGPEEKHFELSEKFLIGPYGGLMPKEAKFVQEEGIDSSPGRIEFPQRKFTIHIDAGGMSGGGPRASERAYEKIEYFLNSDGSEVCSIGFRRDGSFNIGGVTCSFWFHVEKKLSKENLALVMEICKSFKKMPDDLIIPEISKKTLLLLSEHYKKQGWKKFNYFNDDYLYSMTQGHQELVFQLLELTTGDECKISGTPELIKKIARQHNLKYMTWEEFQELE